MLSDLRLTLIINGWWYVLAAVVLFGLAWAVYRYTLPPVTRLRRTFLWLLRAAALCGIAFLLFEPVLRYIQKSRHRPVVAVLVDNSASVAAEADTSAVETAVRDFLDSGQLRRLSGSCDIRTFAFTDTSIEIARDSVARLGFNGVGSNISGAWQNAAKQLSAENVAAMVVVSDGIYNLGENPIRAASASPIPIYALGIGDTSAKSDAIIAEILTNEIAYVGTTVPVDVRIRGTGLKGKTGSVRMLSAAGTLIERKDITFDTDDSENSVSMSFLAEQPGDGRIIVALDSISGEFTTKNNRRSAIIRILDKKSSVVILSGPPTPDLTEIRQTLEQDSAIEVHSYVERNSGDLLFHRDSPTAEDLHSAKLIVAVNWPSRFSPAALVDEVSHSVEAEHKPFLFLAGPGLSSSAFPRLSPILPVRMMRTGLDEQRVVLRSSGNHPAVAGNQPLPLEWADLPPVFGGVGNFGVEAAAQVVVKLSREELGLTEDEPAVALWQFGSRRGAAILCWGTDQWNLQLAASPIGAGFYRDFFQRIRAWLVAPVEESQVRIRTTKKLYSRGEPVRFMAEVYGTDFNPRDEAVVNVKVESEGRTENIVLTRRGNGRYDGELPTWAAGEYRYRGAALIQSDTLGADAGLFAVEEFNIELMDTRARYDVLRKVGDASGGGFAPLAESESLLAKINPQPKILSEQREASLWNRGIMIWLIIGLLSVEWIIRKRNGML